MKAFIYVGFAIMMLSCSSDQRKAEDMTNETEQNVSPNQTVTEEEQARKDSTDNDIIHRDSTANQNDNP